MNFSTGLTAWRDGRSIDDAIKHHDRAQLGVGISLALTFGVTLLKGSKYAALASALDPDTLTAAGVLIAGAIAGFGHWATGGALAGAAVAAPVAGPAGDAPARGQGPLDSPVGGHAAQPAAARDVGRRAVSDDPAAGDLRGGP